MGFVQRNLSVAGLLLFGTTTSLFAKIVYELESEGLDGQTKYFRKPWAMTTVMFLGMSFCLPLAYWQERSQAATRRKAEADASAGAPLLGVPEEAPSGGGLREVGLLALPTLFDLVATVLMNIGLLSVTASVYQMMRGAEMLFAALFAVTFLRRRLNRWHYLGILCCVLGISLVGLSSVLSGEGSQTVQVDTRQMLLGMALIVASQAVQAAQITFEDFFMSNMDIAPLKIVGYEGVIGASLMLGALLPAVYFLPGKDGDGLHEDSLDTWHMITNSRVVGVILGVDMAALLLYNFAGMCVTGHLGAVFRTVLETMRTLFVWLVDLALFYGAGWLGYSQSLGESWSVYSFLQAAGFVVLVAGTLVYGRGDDHEVQREAAYEAVEDGIGEPPLLVTPPPLGGAAPATAGIPTRRVSSIHAGSAPSRPITMGTPSSFKSTINIGSHSMYSASLGRSLSRQASLPRGPSSIQGATPPPGSDV